MTHPIPTTEQIRELIEAGANWADEYSDDDIDVPETLRLFERWLNGQRADAVTEAANVEGDWTSRAWRPQEAETVVKMRKGLLARAERIRNGENICGADVADGPDSCRCLLPVGHQGLHACKHYYTPEAG